MPQTKSRLFRSLDFWIGDSEIKAAQDAGSSGWLLWDPRNRYDGDALAELSSELHWTLARDRR
ncbi:MAG: hypothetical protein ACJ746_30110 [Bryobacteraceae bacterium]